MEATTIRNKIKILIVEDQFIEAYDLQLILEKAGYIVIGIAHSVLQAETILEKEKPDLVCLDIFLDDQLTGIDLAKNLGNRTLVSFIYQQIQVKTYSMKSKNPALWIYSKTFSRTGCAYNP